MEWQDDPQDRAPMTEAIEETEKLRARVTELERVNKELSASFDRTIDREGKLIARVAELEAELARIKSNIDITEAATGMSGIYAKLESEIENQRQLYAAEVDDGN